MKGELMTSKQALEIRLFRRLKTVYTCYTITLAELDVDEEKVNLTAIVERTDGEEQDRFIYFEGVRIPSKDDVGIADVYTMTTHYDDAVSEDFVTRDIEDKEKAIEYAKELQARLTGYAEGILDEQGRLDWVWKDIKV